MGNGGVAGKKVVARVAGGWVRTSFWEGIVMISILL